MRPDRRTYRAPRVRRRDRHLNLQDVRRQTASGQFRPVVSAIRRTVQAALRAEPGVQLVVTPASRDVEQQLIADGSYAKLRAMGATITAPGCGACCGTSGGGVGSGNCMAHWKGSENPVTVQLLNTPVAFEIAS